MPVHFYLVDDATIRLVRKIIEQAGGRLSYRNRQGKQYVEIVRPTGLSGVDVSKLIVEHFPNMYLTSSGFTVTTYRINPET